LSCKGARGRQEDFLRDFWSGVGKHMVLDPTPSQMFIVEALDANHIILYHAWLVLELKGVGFRTLYLNTLPTHLHWSSY
jgi:hypothetical protein